jgi:uncharacterized protein
MTDNASGPERAQAPANGAPDSLARHTLPPSDFDGLSSGLGDAAAIRRLCAAERSVSRAVVARAIASQKPTGQGGEADAWRELVRLDEAGAAGLDEVLAHPYVRSWAARRLKPQSLPGMTRAGEEYAAAIAAAAALRSGESVNLQAAVKEGLVFLPTLGALDLGGPDRPAWITTKPDGTAVVEVDGRDHCISIAPCTQTSTAWQPRRQLQVRTKRDSAELAVWLEDTDPYRDSCALPVSRRLTDDQVALWHERFQHAIDHLADALPDYLAALRAGLTTVTPLLPHPDGHPMSATARHSFGAASLALPPDGPALALLLAHEFQHTKLGALLDLFDLFDPDDDALYYAPWRDDPRPLEGLLQGSYAYVAVTDFWRVQRLTASAGTARQTAQEQFARWRLQTSEAIDVMLQSGSLTALGERFVRGMAEKASTWFADQEQIDPAAAKAALDQARDHRAAWDRRGAGAGAGWHQARPRVTGPDSAGDGDADSDGDGES